MSHPKGRSEAEQGEALDYASTALGSRLQGAFTRRRHPPFLRKAEGQKRAGHGRKSVNGSALASARRKLERLYAAYEAMDGAIQEWLLLAPSRR